MAETKVFPPDNALAFLKADLGFFGSEIAPDLASYLQGLLFTAREDLLRAGVKLSSGTADDDQLQAMYAAWLYRSRVNGQGMPDMLKAAIRNRQVHNATSGNA